VPGVSTEDLQVDIDKNAEIMTVAAKRTVKEHDSSDSPAKKIQSERTAELYRSFRVPQGADYEKIDACLQNGVLELTIQKDKNTERGARRTIKVRSKL